MHRASLRFVTRTALDSHVNSTTETGTGRSLARVVGAKERSSSLEIGDVDSFDFTIQQLWFCVRPGRIFVRLIAPGCVGRTLERPVPIAEIVDEAGASWRMIQVGRRVQVDRYSRSHRRWILRAKGSSEGGWLRASPTRSLRQIAAWVTRRGRGALPIGSSIGIPSSASRRKARRRGESAPARASAARPQVRRAATLT